MLKRSVALALGTLLLAGGALATSTIAPTAGGNPLLVGQGKTVNMTLELITDDQVGALNFELFGSGGLTITCADASDPGTPAYNCTDIAGGIQVNSSDFGVGLATGNDLVDLVFTTPIGGAGAALTLGTFVASPGSTNFTDCPTTFPACIIDGVATAFSNDGLNVVLVVPEPGTAALLAMGLIALAIRRR